MNIIAFNTKTEFSAFLGKCINSKHVITPEINLNRDLIGFLLNTGFILRSEATNIVAKYIYLKKNAPIN